MSGPRYFSISQLRAIELRIRGLAAKRGALVGMDTRYILLDTPDLMELLEISLRTVRYWQQKGILPHFRISRKVYFRLSDVINFVNTVN